MAFRRRRRDDWWPRWFDEEWDRWFPDMSSEFRRLEEWMDDLMRRAERGELKPEEGGPWVYGWSMRVGPDGKPQVQEFGNVPKGQGPAAEGPLPREPMTDVMQTDTEVIITIELPGVAKEDIHVEYEPGRVTIRARAEDQTYEKVVRLPAEVREEEAKATYKNGVLELVLPKAKPTARKGKRIDVE